MRELLDTRPAAGARPDRHQDHGPRQRPDRRRRRRLRPGRGHIAVGVVALLVVGALTLHMSGIRVLPNDDPQSIDHRHGRPLRLEAQSLDGRGNNRRHPDQGRAGTEYRREAAPVYADGVGTPAAGPDVRWISNRIFNDSHQNLFSEGGVTQWGFVWGQFIDHTIGLRDDAGEETHLPFAATDPLEEFTNTLGGMQFTRSAAAPGTGTSADRPREQINTLSSYIDAEAVYGTGPERLEWLREGTVDGDLRNNGARLLLPEGLLPRRDARGDAATAPEMAVDGVLRGQPDRAMVAGDVRANENIALTATQTLFAREHNRIVARLPRRLNNEQKFDIARRVVIAEQQYITYNEFLPALGVDLPRYRGYDPRVDASVSNEFATVGYRAHSMIHGELEMVAAADFYTAEQVEALEGAGVEVAPSEDGSEVELAVPLNVAFFNPDLLAQLHLAPVLQGIGLEAQYRNDEMIDNQLRSVLFQVPVAGNPACLDGTGLPECFSGVVDLGALDIQRGRDHGMPTYNALREAYGLAPVASFADLTGEGDGADVFAVDAELTAGAEVDDPDSLEFTALYDRDGAVVDPADEDAVEGTAVRGDRRTPLAARLKAVYGSVDRVDAFVGMVAEPHPEGAEMGELQMAIWQRQFRALRDGDRFFYGNDPGLRRIRELYALDHRVSLGDVIARNTDIPREALAPNVFFTPVEEPGA